MINQDKNWAIQAKSLLRSEMARKNLNYNDLVSLLGEIGIKESVENIIK
jgi:hypothetical protein